MPPSATINDNLIDNSVTNGNAPKDAFTHEVKEITQNLWQAPNASPEDKRSVEVIRGLVLDCCQEHGIGHGGNAYSLVTLLY